MALGENNGKHSWIIHSAKGIKWRNVPDDLEMLLQKLGIDELLDFSLGSDGRWYVRYRQTGPETYEVSPYLLMELGHESNVELERLALGPGVSHWGVYRTADGLFQPFSSVTNRFSRLMDPETEDSEGSSQINFISLGFGGWWAFGVNGRVEYRCGKAFRNILMLGQKAHKTVSTIVLSPMARVWIIVWEDGTLSHNLPPSMATEVEDYCQLQHSLKKNANKPNFEQPRSQKARHRRNNRSETDSSAQVQPPTTDATETASQELTHDNLTDKAQSPSTQLAIIDPPNVTGVPASPLPAPPPVHRRRPVVPLPVPKAPIAVASPFTRHPATKPVPARLPVSPIEVPKAPSMVNAWNTTQSAWAQQSIKPRLNATFAPATALPPLPPVTPTIIATAVPAAHIIRRSTPFQKPVTEPVSSRLPTTSAQFLKAPYESIVKPVQATQSTTRATPQVPLGWRSRSFFSEPYYQPGRNTSRAEAVSTKPYFYVPPRKPSTTLRLLDPSDWPDVLNYRKIARLFENGWKNQQKQLPKIKRIFAVSLPDHLNESYEEYKELLEMRNGWSGVNEQLVFHGTTRSCSLGEEEEDIILCEKMTCSLCCILRTSFLISKAGSVGRGFNRFGSGIYTSSASSEADDYAIAPWLSDVKAIIVAKAALGKSSIHYRTSEYLVGPPRGYDSVIEEVGIDPNYDEQVVYQDAAIRPAYIVMYERPTSSPVTTAPRPAPQTTRSNMTTTTTKSSTSRGCTIM